MLGIELFAVRLLVMGGPDADVVAGLVFTSVNAGEEGDLLGAWLLGSMSFIANLQ